MEEQEYVINNIRVLVRVYIGIQINLRKWRQVNVLVFQATPLDDVMTDRVGSRKVSRTMSLPRLRQNVHVWHGHGHGRRSWSWSWSAL